MKRVLLALLFLVVGTGVASAQIASEISGGGGGGGIAVGGGSGTAGRVPQFAAGPTLVDSKMLTSGTNSGTWTLYDSVASGVTTFALRAGAGQGTVPSPLLSFFANDGTTVLAQFGAAGTLGFNQAPTTTDTVVITPVGTQSTPLRIKGVGGVAFASIDFEDPYANHHVMAMQDSVWAYQSAGNGYGFAVSTAAGSEYVRVRDVSAGAYGEVAILSESITLDTSGAVTDSVADLLPANAVILGMTWKVTTTIAGVDSTTISFGDATTAARFGTGTVLTSGTTGIGTTQMSGASGTAATGPTQTAAAKLRITLSGGADNTPSAGAVRLTVTFVRLSPPQ